ncbi:aldehyde dehydrogenase [Pseudooceanicola sediminis]|uniref:Aldehyde dehydrogenase n=1 Tax=Pseudooceanicola sediminis TaxID=2211117 RepID=A0A399J066_9RHOB|nr:molybdopterin cofactor-binding domain-containing protein [Pseudooceanicola sediminis]KAA2313941.1 molybdopterin-dependent oxidoreductase [Puniceibacterium sp. HSS470]RII38755.1 aldehyde dehydrogenase [Pseudooceanicola sediminis]|tara:strand:+ start:66526 stop:69882 length:3357 start_codon:yes stop_codon:yes gene_type:complete
MTDALTIRRNGDTFLTLSPDGTATGYNGHVDLGTGLQTALAQIVAEELDLPLSAVRIVLGDTARTPDQGPTIASESIQITAVPLRAAAAQARHWLARAGALRLNAPLADISTQDGHVIWQDQRISYAALLAGRAEVLPLDDAAPLKDPANYTLVGHKAGRTDLPAKLTGDFDYIHDIRLPGMLHGHVIRPPYAGRDSGDFIGRSLISFDDSAIAALPGFVAVVRQADFLAVVATKAHLARQMAEALPVQWHRPPDLPDLSDPVAAIKDHPSSPRVLDTTGDIRAGLADCSPRLDRRYVWPWHMHASIGPSCAVADWNGGAPIVWSGTQNPHMLRGDLATLTGLAPEVIEVRRHQAAGCYGRNCADDVAGDALLLTRALGQRVRVQLTRAQENLWEPKGAAQVMEVSGGVNAAGDFHAYAFDSWYPSNRGPNLALLLTGAISPEPRPSDMGDRTIVPPYRIAHKRITVHDMAPIVRAAWLRGVSALPNTFAHESFVDELAAQAQEDPVAFRLRHLDDPRQADLVRRTAQAAAWQTRTQPTLRRKGRMAYGQGFAYATYVHGAFPGTAAASAAWVVDVAVDMETGEVTLSRVFVGQDQGLAINPDHVRQQIHGNVIQTASRALQESVSFDQITVTDQSWATYPLATFPQTPQIETMLVARPDDPPLGVGESAGVPAAAAIANAIFDATGVRMREVPFTPERMRDALGIQPRQSAPLALPGRRKRKTLLATTLGLTAALGLGALSFPLARAIPKTTAPAAANFSAETLTRGETLFALGNCASCHTAPDGAPNAGGRAIDTPFGTVHSTNLTPDPDTGLGTWSFAAFARAMRAGISRDGHNLYPAFPYTSFAGMAEDDLFALYAHLQTLPAVAQPTPKAQMSVPRPALAAWNALFHRPQSLAPDPAQGADWNRGRYLVETVGHCSECHTPRTALGAQAKTPLSGAMVRDWFAPALAGPDAQLRGTDDIAAYLSTGVAPGRAAASGPMAEVIAGLSTLPDGDITAMATYLASLPTDAPAPLPEQAATIPDRIDRIFANACASCHEAALPDLLTAAQIPLTRAPAIRAPSPAAAQATIRDGLRAPTGTALRDMPAFGADLAEADILALARYLRARYAPDLPGWD